MADEYRCTDGWTDPSSVLDKGRNKNVAICGKIMSEMTVSSQPAEDALVLVIPSTALIPEGATFYEGDDDKRCRLIKPDGTRCRATRTRAYGLCSGHAGIGGVASDPAGMARKASTERVRRAEARLTLGISARRAAQPLQVARVAAQRRSEDIARALVDDPLDGDMKPADRHRAILASVQLLYPQVTASMSVDVPDDVTQLGWDELQALAAQHLGEDAA